MSGTHPCVTIDSWHSAGPHSRERPYAFVVGTYCVDFPLIGGHSTVQDTSFWQPWKGLPGTYPAVPPTLTFRKRLLNGCIRVYTFSLLYYVSDLRTYHSISCLGLLLT